jgi:dihydroxyacetone kinase phosphotransfer subunit
MTVALVIVSHSPKIAEGVADLVRQMVGDEVAVAWTGGDPGGGLGTDPARIQDAIMSVDGPDGVAVLFDLGGAETNSEMAIELLPEEVRARVELVRAPLVEGAILAATEAASGGGLAEVHAAARESLA